MLTRGRLSCRLFLVTPMLSIRQIYRDVLLGVISFDHGLRAIILYVHLGDLFATFPLLLHAHSCLKHIVLILFSVHDLLLVLLCWCHVTQVEAGAPSIKSFPQWWDGSPVLLGVKNSLSWLHNFIGFLQSKHTIFDERLFHLINVSLVERAHSHFIIYDFAVCGESIGSLISTTLVVRGWVFRNWNALTPSVWPFRLRVVMRLSWAKISVFFVE